MIVTDVWSSMGHEGSETERKKIFKPYQITESLLDLAKENTLFMHCLPAHRGEEVNETILDDERSVVWHEAGNRLHSQKALVEFMLKESIANPLARTLLKRFLVPRDNIISFFHGERRLKQGI